MTSKFTFFDRHLLSITHLILLLLFSLSLTDFYQHSRNVGWFFMVFTLIILNTVFFEVAFNRKNLPREEFFKKMALYVVPMNIVIFAVFVLFVFE